MEVLSCFDGVSDSLIDAIKTQHSSCLVVPKNWVEIFKKDYEAALKKWLAADEAALKAVLAASRVENFRVSWEQEVLLFTEEEVKIQRAIVHRHLVIVAGDKEGLAAICAEKYAADCRKHVGLPDLPLPPSALA